MYFPLIVHEALMLEPTETEGPETLEHAAAVLRQLYQKAMTTRRPCIPRPTTCPSAVPTR